MVAERRPGRSPYGERGLKFHRHPNIQTITEVALLTESVD